MSARYTRHSERIGRRCRFRPRCRCRSRGCRHNCRQWRHSICPPQTHRSREHSLLHLCINGRRNSNLTHSPGNNRAFRRSHRQSQFRNTVLPLGCKLAAYTFPWARTDCSRKSRRQYRRHNRGCRRTHRRCYCNTCANPRRRSLACNWDRPRTDGCYRSSYLDKERRRSACRRTHRRLHRRNIDRRSYYRRAPYRHRLARIGPRCRLRRQCSYHM